MTLSPELTREFELSDERIAYIRRSRMGAPHKLTFDLSIAATDLIQYIQGNFLYVQESSDLANRVYVKFNSQDQDSFPLEKAFGFKTPYEKMYFSWTAQPGQTMTIIYGSLATEFLDVLDHRGEVVAATLLQTIANNTRNLVTIPVGATRILASAQTNNAQSATIYTVPVGRTFYLTEANIAFAPSSAAAPPYATIYDGANRLLVCRGFYNVGAGYVAPNTVAQHFSPPIEFPAGTVLKIQQENYTGALVSDYSQATMQGYII
jgi:hypothetical protein